MKALKKLEPLKETEISMVSPSAIASDDKKFMKSFLTRDGILWLILAVFTFIAYYPSWNGKPIWDDAGHITKPELRSLQGLVQIWIMPGATQQYYPIVHSVFWIEYHLWGEATPGYHFLNILLHLISALLLVKILRLLRIRGAWLAAAIFALHPVQVESVAWISELKNTLSAVFFLGSVLAYLKFDSDRNPKRYALAAGLFILGLLSKSVIAPLPAALLVLFWWKRGKLLWSRDMVPLLPFFLAGAASGLFTSWVERTYVIGGEVNDFHLALIDRFLIAGRAIWFYPAKLLWPVNLIFIYPRWHIDSAEMRQYFYPITALLFAGALWVLRRRTRAPLAVFLFFSAMLFPALGFFDVYPFRFSFVADHFQYLACLGPIVYSAAMVDRAFGLVKRRDVACYVSTVVYAILLAGLGLLTWRQCGIYKDVDGLYKSILEKNPACWMAQFNLGNDLMQRGDVPEAISHFWKAIEARPGYTLAYINLGNALMQIGRTGEGIAQYQKALLIDSTNTSACINLGNAFMQNGRFAEGMAQYLRAQKINPGLAVAHYDLGNGYMQMGRFAEGMAEYRKTLELDSNYASAHVNIGKALLQTGRTGEAIVHLERALFIDPANPEAQSCLGYALVQSGYYDEAIPHFQKALKVHPDDFRCISTLRDAYLKTGQLDEAIRVTRKAIDVAKSLGGDSMAMGISRDLDKLLDLQKANGP